MSSTDQALRESIVGHLVGYQATWIADIGLKAGLLDAIATTDEGVGEDDLADRLGDDKRLFAAWCRSAYALELLDWNIEHGYRLPDEVG